MSVSVTMPRLGESVSEGTVTRWLKKEGERVEADEPLLEVSTDKVDTEIPAPASGVLSAIRVGEDETVEVGVELAVIDESGGSAGSAEPAQQAEPEAQEAEQPEPRQPAPQQPAPEATPQQPAARQPAPQAPPAQAPAVQAPPPQAPAPQAPAPQAPQPQWSAPQPTQAPPAQPAQAPQHTPEQDAAEAPPSGDGAGGAYVTPLVRKLAAEHDVDLSTLTGTGVGGRIRKQDVLEAARGRQTAPAQQSQPAAQAQAPATKSASTPAAVSPLRGRTEKMSRLRTVIAQRMHESLQVSAQLTTVVEVDVTTIARLRSRAKVDFEAREGVKLSFLPFFAIAAVEALKQHPAVNASIDTEAGTITYHDAEHLGVAVDTERGLLVPVIHDAGDLNLGGMARKIADLAERTRGNKVSPDELGGGTFTLTNTGSRGALFDTPIINQPQVGILGTGAVVKRPVVVDDPDLGEVIAVRSMVYLALTYDHRLVDGADAARFLVTVKDRLEAGAFEADLGLV
jgi:pyruvate dehydrogenase E2 component (dihydrolipoamide acetyltransferase)